MTDRLAFRIPLDVQPRAIGLTLEVPVGDRTIPVKITHSTQAVRVRLTRANIPAKAAKAKIVTYLDGVWSALRNHTMLPLSQRQAHALAGELYDAWQEERVRTLAVDVDKTTGKADLVPSAWLDAEGYEAAAEQLGADTTDLNNTFGPLLDRMLLRKGIAALAPDSRPMVLSALHLAVLKGLRRGQREAAGDYTPDAAQYPQWEKPQAPKVLKPHDVTLAKLVELWWAEAKAAGRSLSTYRAYVVTFNTLTAFLGHDDPRSVTNADVVRFKDHRLAGGTALKTVRDRDLAAIRSVFRWAVSNNYAANNPATGVEVIKIKTTKLRGKDFTSDEAVAILRNVAAYQPGAKEHPKTTLAKRWVPWLCAYTGARVGEIVQLRPQDVSREGDLVVITITPEAGTVKDKELRKVVLHEHIAAGFEAVAKQARGDQFMFLPNTNGDPLHMLSSVVKRVGDIARNVVNVKGVSPNHAWRHTFKTIGRSAGISDRVLDEFTGHAPATEGGAYGSVTLQAQAKALESFPRFPVDFA